MIRPNAPWGPLARRGVAARGVGARQPPVRVETPGDATHAPGLVPDLCRHRCSFRDIKDSPRNPPSTAASSCPSSGTSSPSPSGDHLQYVSMGLRMIGGPHRMVVRGTVVRFAPGREGECSSPISLRSGFQPSAEPTTFQAVVVQLSYIDTKSNREFF